MAFEASGAFLSLCGHGAVQDLHVQLCLHISKYNIRLRQLNSFTQQGPVTPKRATAWFQSWVPPQTSCNKEEQ